MVFELLNQRFAAQKSIHLGIFTEIDELLKIHKLLLLLDLIECGSPQISASNFATKHE